MSALLAAKLVAPLLIPSSGVRTSMRCWPSIVRASALLEGEL